jgi:molybdopterin converting factor small subunit
VRIRLRYVALLRDERGLAEETVDCAPGLAARDLYQELRARHAFSLPPERLLVAVNDEFAPWERPLAEDDLVIFLPPVAGG